MEPTTENIWAIRKATGFPISRAKEFIVSNPDDLCRRIIVAKYKNGRLYDPVEDDLNILPYLEKARLEASKIADDLKCRRKNELEAEGMSHIYSNLGWCHVYWREMKRILEEEYNIIWYSPDQMNPGCAFD